MPEGPLSGKVAIITGAGSPIGLGHAMAVGLASAGARVALVDLKADWLEHSANDVRAVGGQDCALPVAADITDPAAVGRAVEQTLAELGGLHILINNAGINQRSAGYTSGGANNFWDLTPEAWNRVVAVNLSGAFFMARAVTRHMLAQGWGRIIGVTTSMDSMWRKYGTPYGPSKAGHEALVAIMAQELDGTGVTANVLVPGGPTHTNMTAANTAYDLNKLIRPEVMQAPAVWLASEASQAFTGRRIIAYYWDTSLPLEERLEKASAPAAWPQLGQQMIAPT
jgi:NAD(P)-dependent dehydrogenase (short-subunit alcohol dehydrogenase family)